MGLKRKGKIIEWNPNKGFGFIHSNVDPKGIFVHISDFKNRQYKPKLGDIIVYEIGNGRDNKKKAINAVCEGDFTSATKYKKTSRAKRKLYLVLPLILVWVIFLSNKDDRNEIDSRSLGSYRETVTSNNNGISIPDSVMEEEVNKEMRDDIVPFTTKGAAERYNKNTHQKRNTNRKYTCDSRKYCNQMHSCEEAKFFIRHCPNTRMDGDMDGIPCERQWCNH